jgi:hypothetical protein
MVDNQQVGHLSGHASIWNGTPESRIDLHPSGAWYSQANAASGDEQVGFVIPNIAGDDRATLWRGTAASAVTLHPPGALFSSANGVAGGRQAGAAFYADVAYRAVMWSGTAESMVSMHPPGAHQSAINGMVVGQQAGWVGLVGVGHHAAIWSGTAESFVDIHPQGAGVSELLATCGVAQAGWANTAQFGITAGVWFGSAQSFVALGGLLPSNYGLSQATSIAEANGVVYVGGWAENNLTGQREAVLWTGAVPAPGAAAVLVFAGVFTVRRAARRGGAREREHGQAR